jgi:hypothetical protein
MEEGNDSMTVLCIGTYELGLYIGRDQRMSEVEPRNSSIEDINVDDFRYLLFWLRTCSKWTAVLPTLSIPRSVTIMDLT